MTRMEQRLVYELTTDIPYLALTGKLWNVYCVYFEDNWLHCNETLEWHFILRRSPIVKIQDKTHAAKMDGEIDKIISIFMVPSYWCC